MKIPKEILRKACQFCVDTCNKEYDKKIHKLAKIESNRRYFGVGPKIHKDYDAAMKYLENTWEIFGISISSFPPSYDFSKKLLDVLDTITDTEVELSDNNLILMHH